MGASRLSRTEALFVIGAPIAWALLLLLHPGGDGTQIYADLDGDGTRMLIVHVGTMVFIPAMALAVYLLLRGLDSTAARVSRVGLVLFVVAYTAWEALQGIANGILVDEVTALAETDHAVGADLIQAFAESPLVRDFGILSAIGSIAFVVAGIAAGLALRDDGAPRWAPAVLGVAALLITAHPPPFGPTGLLIFAVAVVLMRRAQPQGAPQPELSAPARARFTGGERAFLLGVPIAWALLLLLHPTGEGEDFYPIIADEQTTWLLVHIGTLVFVPLMAGVVLLLTRGLRGSAALISRVALGAFAVVYMVWEVLIGVGNGVLVDEIAGLSAAQESVGPALVEGFSDSGLIATFEIIGVTAWLVALVAAGIALVREAGASPFVPLLFVLSAIPTAWHVTPFGQAGLLLFLAGVLLTLRSESPTPETGAVGRPVPA